MQGTLHLFAYPDHVGWTEQIQGVRIGATLSFVTDAAKSQFPAKGFKNQQYDHPIVFFDYPNELKPNEAAGFTINGQSLTNFFGGARGTKHIIEEQASANVFLSLDWKQIQMLESDGIMSVFLHDRSGVRYKTLQIPRQHFEEIEHRLKAMYAKVLGKESDRQHLCDATSHEAEPTMTIID